MKKQAKFSKQARMLFDKEDLRWATPEIVADYRARRLKCDLIVDLCCGIGGQSIFFGKYCKKVIAVDKDGKKIEFAKKNAEVYGVKNINFLVGDVLDKKIVNKIKKLKPDILFCDPTRLEQEKERDITNIIPKIDDIAHAYRINDFAFEVPPQLNPEKIHYNCEKEYVSVNKKLNRLTLYFGKLKKNKVNVVALPSESKIADSKTKINIINSKEPKKYLYEVDTAVIKANLLDELINDINNKIKNKKNIFLYHKDKITLLISDKIINNDFLTNYKLIKKTNNNFNSIIKILKKNKIGKVILRARIKPQDYWKQRKCFEHELEGKKAAYLFILDENALVCGKL